MSWAVGLEREREIYVIWVSVPTAFKGVKFMYLVGAGCTSRLDKAAN